MALSAVRVLAPTAPKKVIAIGFNYGSHLGEADPAAEPGVFTKHPTSVIPHEDEITYYADATNLHYEGEMVLIIGRTAKNVPPEEANDYISPSHRATTSASASGKAATSSGSVRREPTPSDRWAR